jgi:dihydrofolate reductase
VVENPTAAGGFLFRRRTYESFAGHWPNASEEEQVIAEPLNTRPKYVASTTLTDPLEWQNSTVLQGDVAEAVVALKQDDGGDLYVLGSTELVRTLIEHDLVDESG